MTPTPEQLNAAISSLQPDAPIYAVETGADGSITLVLPSKRLVYTPSGTDSPSLREGAGGGKPTPPPDIREGAGGGHDFTCIPYVGREIATALHNAGFHTFDDLVTAPDTALLDVPHISAYTLRKIREYLQKHYL